MENYHIGIDLGGTKIASAICDKEGKILHSITIPTEADKGPKHVIWLIQDLIKNLLKKTDIDKKNIKNIVIGVPGPINKEKGVVIQAPNLSGWHNIKIVKEIKSVIKCEVILENDANCATMGEYQYGAGKPFDNMVFMTVSTGIGGGIIINKRLISGNHSIAGEIGHMSINVSEDKDVPECGCGRKGCLEAYASGTAMAKRAKKILKSKKNLSSLKSGGEVMLDLALGDINKITSVVISKAADEGDKLALKLIEDNAKYIGIGIVNIINLIDPETIIIGGGVSLIGKKLFDNIHKTVKKYSSMTKVVKTQILPAKLGGEAGLYGTLAIGITN